MRTVWIAAVLVLGSCGVGSGLVKDVPRDQCQSILEEVRAKANRPPKLASRYDGNWVMAGAGGAPIRIVKSRGKIVMRVLAQPEPGMTSSDQQGVIAEHVGSSDERGLYLYMNGRPSDGAIRLRLYDNSKLEGTSTDSSCRGFDMVMYRN